VRWLNLPLPTILAMLTTFPLLWLLETLGLQTLPSEGMYITWCNNPVDCSYTERELGMRFRPAAEAVAATGRWLVEAGHARGNIG